MSNERFKDKEVSYAQSLVDCVNQYCSENSYRPEKVEVFTPRFTPSFGDFASSYPPRPAEIWISVDGTRPDPNIEETLVDLTPAMNYLQYMMVDKDTPLQLRTRYHYAFFPHNKISGTKISGGDNLLLDKNQGNDFVIITVLPKKNSAQYARENTTALSTHEATHSMILAMLHQSPIECMKNLRQPNHIHPLLDEGLASVMEAFQYASRGKNMSEVIGNDEILARLIEQDALLITFFRRRMFGLTLSKNAILSRSFSRRFLDILQGIETGNIDLLDPDLINEINFRKTARTRPDGQFEIPFVDQDISLYFTYLIGRSLVWIDMKACVRTKRNPFSWYMDMLKRVQKEYLTSADGIVDFWQIIRQSFPDLKREDLNKQLIVFLKKAHLTMAQAIGYPQPENHLGDFIRTYGQLEGLEKGSDELNQKLEENSIFKWAEELNQAARKTFDRTIKSLQQVAGVNKLPKRSYPFA